MQRQLTTKALRTLSCTKDYFLKQLILYSSHFSLCLSGKNVFLNNFLVALRVLSALVVKCITQTSSYPASTNLGHFYKAVFPSACFTA